MTNPDKKPAHPVFAFLVGLSAFVVGTVALRYTLLGTAWVLFRVIPFRTDRHPEQWELYVMAAVVDLVVALAVPAIVSAGRLLLGEPRPERPKPEPDGDYGMHVMF